MSDGQVSVVVTCYNQKSYIAEAVTSVIRQSASKSIQQIIIVDDGSSDGSVAEIDRLAKFDSRISVIRQINGGAAAARNAGIKLSKTEYVAFLDGDDVWMPEKVERQLEIARQTPSAGLLFCDFVEFDDCGGGERPVRVRMFEASDPDPLVSLFRRAGPIIPSAALVRREVFSSCGLFDPTLRCNEDPELWLRIAAQFPLQKTPGVLVRKRIVPGSLGAALEANARVQQEITRRMILAHPRLAPWRKERDLRLATMLAVGAIRTGDRRLAVTHAVQALRAKPLSLRAAAVAALALFPHHLSRKLLGG